MAAVGSQVGRVLGVCERGSKFSIRPQKPDEILEFVSAPQKPDEMDVGWRVIGAGLGGACSADESIVPRHPTYVELR